MLSFPVSQRTKAVQRSNTVAVLRVKRYLVTKLEAHWNPARPDMDMEMETWMKKKYGLYFERNKCCKSRKKKPGMERRNWIV